MNLVFGLPMLADCQAVTGKSGFTRSAYMLSTHQTLAEKISGPEDIAADTATAPSSLQCMQRRLRELGKILADNLIALNRFQEGLDGVLTEQAQQLSETCQELQHFAALLSEEREVWERSQAETVDKARMLNTIFDAIPDVLGVLDPERRILRYNTAGYEFIGRHRDEVIGKHCFELIDQSAPCDLCPVKIAIESGAPAQIEKYLDDRQRWFDLRAYPILDENDQVVRVIEHLRDITEIKQAEAAIRESEAKYRALVENANEAIFILQDGRFKFPNRRAIELARRHKLRIREQPFINYVHADDQKMLLERHMKRIKKEPLSDTCHFRIVTGNRDIVWMELNSALIQWEGKPATLNFMRDITRQKKLENQFHEAQRMESLGTLAGGIAHDFNNLLMGIQGNVSLLYINLEEDDELCAKLGSIEDCVESGSQLTKQLLGFARGGKYVVKPIDPNQLVRASVDLFGRTHKELKMHCSFVKDIWNMEADQGQLEQVLMNLYLNAYQAMEKGGDIYVKTDNLVLEEKTTRPHEAPGGRYIRISVTDTGEGMDRETQLRIFEPFFTTKEIGRGTGLGLASAFGIVKNHNGFITVESEVGRGSTFQIHLPATEKRVDGKDEAAGIIQPGTETILLVDDEDYIIEVGRLMLEGLGYTILTANCGRAGMEMFAAHRKEIDLVILDMIMPDIGGSEVFDHIRKLRSDAKILLSSGYNMDFQASSLMGQGCDGFIQKPFNLKSFSAKIREILDG
jgi:two-component system, cell cycle sensor histidine kinase and response regulator CckA